MEGRADSKTGIDFRKYDRVWERVLPLIDPWGADGARDDARPIVKTPLADGAPPIAEGAPLAADGVPPIAGNAPALAETIAGKKTEAEVLADLIEEELSEHRRLLALVRICPAWGRQTLRELAAASGGRAKRLSAVYYLITGESYAPALCVDRMDTGPWLPILRERGHAAARAALNYSHLAEETANPCLRRFWEELSAAACQNAAALIRLLERAVTAGRAY